MQDKVRDMYTLRHVDVTDASLPDKGFPIGRGGTFQNIAQHAWSDSDTLLRLTHTMLVATELLDPSDSIDDMGEKYMTLALLSWIQSLRALRRPRSNVLSVI